MQLPSYELRKNLFIQNSIYEAVNQHMDQGHISEFDNELWEKIKCTDVFMLRDFFQIFEEGLNIGTCGLTARYLSYIFDDFVLVEDGFCNILRGTKGSIRGEHAWLEVGGFIYDTTLLLKIDKATGYKLFGYEPIIMTTSEKLLNEDLYILQKGFANDVSSIRWKKKLANDLKKNGFKCSALGV